MNDNLNTEPTFSIIIISSSPELFIECMNNILCQKYPHDLIKFYVAKNRNLPDDVEDKFTDLMKIHNVRSVCEICEFDNSWVIAINESARFIDECGLLRIATCIMDDNNCDDYMYIWKYGCNNSKNINYNNTLTFNSAFISLVKLKNHKNEIYLDASTLFCILSYVRIDELIMKDDKTDQPIRPKKYYEECDEPSDDEFSKVYHKKYYRGYPDEFLRPHRLLHRHGHGRRRNVGYGGKVICREQEDEISYSSSEH